MKYLIWDFDGTLGYRIGKWSGALLQVLQREMPDYVGSAAHIRPHLSGGFPWHNPEIVRLPNERPDDWWAMLQPVFVRAFRNVAQIDDVQAKELARMVRAVYTDTTGWRLFDDSIRTLERLSSLGWKHIVLSNHVPELPTIIAALGLNDHIINLFNSASTGVEKPHPRAFHGVLESLDGVSPDVWMIGDNPVADIAGARAVGLKAIIVRGVDERAHYCCDTLDDIPLLPLDD